MPRFRGQYAWLSNFYEVQITIGNDVYMSVEAAFQACKCKDPRSRYLFIKNRNPAQCKQYGRHIPIRDDWDEVKVDVMCWLLYAKFSTPELKRLLLEVDDSVLVEENDWNDTYWGVCNGRGVNMLGKCLKRVKDRLSREQ